MNDRLQRRVKDLEKLIPLCESDYRKTPHYDIRVRAVQLNHIEELKLEYFEITGRKYSGNPHNQDDIRRRQEGFAYGE